MAKRFTDTEKWRDEWWGSLSNDYRIIWLYLIDSCSIAGIWKKDFRGLNFNCNTNISETDFITAFGSRLIDCKSFYFIPKFLLFQYPTGLNSDKPAIVSIRKEILLNNLSGIIHKSLPNGYLTVKDKDKDTDKVKDKESDRAFIREHQVYGKHHEDNFLLIVPKNATHPTARINELEGMIEYFGANKSIVKKSNEFGKKFIWNNPGKPFYDFQHLYNAYADFVKEQYK